MSFRRRMVLLTAAAVAVSVLLIAAAAYVAVGNDLNDRVNSQLRTLAGTVAVIGRVLPRALPGQREPPAVPRFPQRGIQTAGDVALITANGQIYRAPYDNATFALTPRDRAVARGTGHSYFRDANVRGTPVRVFVTPAGRGHAVIAEESLTDLEHTLHQLALILAAIVLVGVGLAGLLALLVVRIGTAPVHALRQAAEHVGSTGDLTRRITTTGNDDVARLGASFNTMLAALQESQRAQQQLVADASHELRTPIASLRTNLEVLQRAPDLDEADRSTLLRDLVEQSAELGALVADLLDSARDADEHSRPGPVRLDLLVATEVERYAAQNPGLQLQTSLEPCVVVARENRLRRAIGNLLDNATKWSPPDGHVAITLADGNLSVRDHGPGFRAQDLPYVFDRFYRSPAARSVPGAGLGLAIVEKVSREHGGGVSANNAPDGGALVTLNLPTAQQLAGTPSVAD